MSAATAPFVWDFELQHKSITTDFDGSVYIEGLASDYLPDRDDEWVDRDAMREGLQRYMATNPIVLFMHKWEKAVGQVVAARIDHLGLHVKARLDAATDPTSWQADILNKVKSGTLRSFSIGGRFHKDGPRIHKVDLMEISIATVPINARSLFRVVAGKAFADGDQLELGELRYRLNRAAKALEEIRMDRTSLLAVSLAAEAR